MLNSASSWVSIDSIRLRYLRTWGREYRLTYVGFWNKRIHSFHVPVFIRASILERSLLFCITGVSFRSTSLRFPLEPFDAARPANSDAVAACAVSMASLASAGKNNLANATVMYTTTLDHTFNYKP